MPDWHSAENKNEKPWSPPPHGFSLFSPRCSFAEPASAGHLSGQASARPPGKARVPSLPQPAEAGSPLKEGAVVYKREKHSNDPRSHEASTWGKHPTQAQAAQPTPNAHRRQSRRSNTRQVKRSHARLRALMSASGRTNPTQRESQGPNNPHPAAASRASGSNCGRRCTITYPA